MPDSFFNRLRVAWNVFRFGEDNTYLKNLGIGYSYRPDRLRMLLGNERSIISSIYTRIGIDCAAIPLRHVRLDEDKNFKEYINSGLDNCLNLEANIDQTGRAFIQDVVMSLCDEGSVAIVPVDTSINPSVSGSYDILSLRTAKIMHWYPEYVRLLLYNDRIGLKQEIVLPKRMVAIIENPLYSVMNEPNSTYKRLIDKLNLLDAIDEQSGSGKLDIILQLPYVIKTEKREADAEKRRVAIEKQLKDSKYGVAYVDGTERITQLNRPVENNLMNSIQFLTSMLYSQLGITEEVFNGTAEEAAMLNYWNRTVEPFLSAIADGMKRIFLTKTGRSQGQSIMFVRDPFKLAPTSQLAEIADKFTRNEIVTSNEFRSVLGMRPSDDPGADELRNKNLNPASSEQKVEPAQKMDESNQNGRSKFDYAEK